jgi:multidrug efflux pump subunit AcrB
MISTRIAVRGGAKIQLVEMPPGPPVLSTIVAEIYGTPDKSYDDLIAAARTIEALMREEPFVVDVDTLTEADHDRFDFVVDREKAALARASARHRSSAPCTWPCPVPRRPGSIRPTNASRCMCA